MSEYVENRVGRRTHLFGGPANFAFRSSRPEQNDRWGEGKREKNKAKCEIHNMSSDEGLSRDGSIAGRKSKPPICATAQCSLPVADVPTGSTDHVGRDRLVGAETPVFRRLAAGRPAGRTCRLARETLKSDKTKPKAIPSQWFDGHGLEGNGWVCRARERTRFRFRSP